MHTSVWVCPGVYALRRVDHAHVCLGVSGCVRVYML